MINRKKVSKVLLPIIVLVVCVFIAKTIISSKEPPKQRPAPPSVSVVEAKRLKRTDYRVIIKSQGTVSPRTESSLVPEVSGVVAEISPDFDEGGFFEKGELLLRIDPRNYETDVTVARATLAKARLALAEEEARSKQALKNWQRLGEGGSPSELVLRKPQLESAQADVEAASAGLKRKELDLIRTHIRAPYSGRVLEKNIDIGEYITPGTIIAKIYAIDYAEVRLPLSSKQLEFVDIPELYRGESAGKKDSGPKVALSSAIGSKSFTWNGRVIRSEGAIDRKSRQLFVIAQVKDPYGKKTSGAPPLKVGQFVEAAIKGHLLKDVFVIPRSALREGGELLIATDNKLERRKIKLLWKDKENVIVTASDKESNGLKEGELVVLTPAVYGISGSKVRVNVEGEEAVTKKRNPKEGKK